MFSWFKKVGPRSAATAAGTWGEQLAAAWLRRERKFAVVVRNWRNPLDERDELDLVCRDGEALVFVEVKARTEGGLVRGFDAVDARKKRVLRRSIQAYLARLRHKPHTFRLDVVEVILPITPGKVPPGVVHIENVPLFGKHFRA